jgi:serine/threonine protein kinase/tetratricopeptide (TPR) repeat protein
VIGRTVSHYQILEEIGAGGMGVVYRAQDTRLKRFVALKFLPPELTRDEAAKKRLLREAQAVSTLQHHNICTIHEIDETDDGRMFICMDYYEGETLKTRLERGPLAVEEAVDVMMQVARGLEDAHRRGIVHRDIKPANVMVTKQGVAKILDFGLAKLAGQTKVTMTGSTMGTVAYMSPEQVRGEELDPRSDIFSLGVMLYELLTGTNPFAADHAPAIMYKILNVAPPSLRNAGVKHAARIDSLAVKMLAKEPGERYASAHEVIAELSALRVVRDDGRTDGSRAGLDSVQQEHESSRPAGDASGRPSIAVLYLENLGHAGDDDFFRDGITEDITTELAKIDGVSVFPRAAVISFRDQAPRVADVSRQLNATHVVSGSVRRAGERLRVNLQLVQARTGHVAWAERYDRAVHDIFDVQEDIARNVAQALRISLSPREDQRIAQKPTASLEAYDLFLRGRNYTRRQNRPQALAMFEGAIALDANFALAHAGLANICAMQYYVEDRNRTWIDRAEAAVNRAFAIAPQLPEAFVALARIHYAQQRYPDTVAAARAAIAIKPDCEGSWDMLGRALFASDQWEEAVSLVERAIQATGEDYNVYVPYGNALLRLGRNEESDDLTRRHIAVLERHIVWAPEDTRARILLAVDYVRFQRNDEAVVQMEKALATGISDPHSLFNVACVYALIGDKRRALDALKASTAAGYSDWDSAERDPDLRSLHGDPEFKRWLKDGRLPG